MANYELLGPNFNLNSTMKRQLNYNSNFRNFHSYQLQLNYGFNFHIAVLQERLNYSEPKFAFRSLHRISGIVCSLAENHNTR